MQVAEEAAEAEVKVEAEMEVAAEGADLEAEVPSFAEARLMCDVIACVLCRTTVSFACVCCWWLCWMGLTFTCVLELVILVCISDCLAIDDEDNDHDDGDDDDDDYNDDDDDDEDYVCDDDDYDDDAPDDSNDAERSSV